MKGGVTKIQVYAIFKYVTWLIDVLIDIIIFSIYNFIPFYTTVEEWNNNNNNNYYYYNL